MRPLSFKRVSGRVITFNGFGSIYDITGRKVADFKDRYVFKKAGIYFIKVGNRVFKIIIR